MAYILQKDESVNEGIKRIITEKIQSSLDYLHEEDENKRDDSILEVRTNCKRIRAVLRLVRHEIGEKTYQKENIFYRDIARKLSPVRDAFMVIETLDKALKQLDEPDLQDCGAKIRNLLIADYEAVRDNFWGQDILSITIEKLEHALSNIDTLKIKQTGFKAVEDGLYNTYRRGYKALPKAYENIPAIEPFHEWRKWIKYLRYQLQVLKDSNAEVLSPYIKEIKLLSDILGDAHDFAVLREHIAQFEQAQSGAGRQLLAQLDYLRGQLELDAKPLAEKVYDEEPQKFVKRIRGYWKSW